MEFKSWLNEIYGQPTDAPKKEFVPDRRNLDLHKQALAGVVNPFMKALGKASGVESNPDIIRSIQGAYSDYTGHAKQTWDEKIKDGLAQELSITVTALKDPSQTLNTAWGEFIKKASTIHPEISQAITQAVNTNQKDMGYFINKTKSKMATSGQYTYVFYMPTTVEAIE